jgi:hypothetical protein
MQLVPGLASRTVETAGRGYTTRDPDGFGARDIRYQTDEVKLFNENLGFLRSHIRFVQLIMAEDTIWAIYLLS